MITISKMKKICRCIYDHDYRWLIMAKHGLYKNLPDEEYLKRKFKCHTGKVLDLNHPKTMNEKLQWLKLYDRKDIYTIMVDKYLAKKYVGNIIGEEYIIPTLGVWDDPNSINFDALPNKFVLKCNHNSGKGLCICKNKSMLNINKVKAELQSGLNEDYYLNGREWPYKNVPRKIIAEKYMTDNESVDTFTDYKFYCFNGYVDSVMVCIDRNIGSPKFYFFDKNWNLKRYNKRGLEAPKNFTLPKPDGIEKMFYIAGILSQKIPFLRVDLYNSSGKIYFGELTFFPDSGWDPNRLPETDLYFGHLIDLENLNKYD